MGEDDQVWEMPFTPPSSKQPQVNLHHEIDTLHDVSHENTIELPLNISASLPTLHAIERSTFRRPEECLPEFYEHDLDVQRLTHIYDWLWLAGRPEPARPLHRQKILRREITIVEQADLHLVWDGSRIFIKPLPQYLLYKDFWKAARTHNGLRESACGFIRSYSWLIRYESDFTIATELHLIPPTLKWAQWRKLIAECYYTHPPALDSTNVNKRYCYGELRQGRLNLVYRVFRGQIFRGYEYGYNQYGTFFSRNFAWIITVFAYVTIALTAMQVGLATEGLGKDGSFQGASYGFAISSLLLPLILLGMALTLFILIFMNNFIATRKTVQKQKAVGYLV